MTINNNIHHSIEIYNSFLGQGNVRSRLSDLYLELSPNEVFECVQVSYNMLKEESSKTLKASKEFKDADEIYKKAKEMDVMYFIHGNYNYCI